MSLRYMRVFGAATAALLLTTAGAPAALAMIEPDPRETHCVIDVLGELPTGEFIVSEPRCYSTFPQAVADETDGTVRLASGTKGTVLFEDAETAAAVSSFTLGTHFDGANGTGSSISVTGSSCTGGYWNTSASWDNRISSSYNGCGRLRHYDYANKGGSAENTYGAGATDNLGVLNNRTESVSYHSS
jgi:hypothetical protein